MNRRSFMGMLGLAPVCAVGVAAASPAETGWSGELIRLEGLPLASNLSGGVPYPSKANAFEMITVHARDISIAPSFWCGESH